ncbi:MAG TPA: DUF2291 domain-containing protein [Lachnospiraceae bacterium]|nr:DUF2291 domain-containing protein [Lachnospiraceae bacterium]
MKKSIVILTLAAAFTVSSATGCKVIPIGTESEYTGANSFDASEGSDSLWADQLVPEINEKAVDLTDLLNQSGGDLFSDTASAMAAKVPTDSSAAASKSIVYAVKGTGTVMEVVSKAVSEEASSKGYLLIKPDGYDGEDVIKIAVGPVNMDTSLRDAVDFMDINNYNGQKVTTNEWAQVASNINGMVQDYVIANVDLASAQDKTVEFTGAFSVSSTKKDELFITPVALEFK